MSIEEKMEFIRINDFEDPFKMISKLMQIKLLYDAKLISREKLCNLLDIDAKTIDALAIFE